MEYPQDIVVVQEIFWRSRPDLVVETWIDHGGSIIFSTSMLELLGEANAAHVRQLAEGRRCVLVLLDSNHTHVHVLRELGLYSPWCSRVDTLLFSIPSSRTFQSAPTRAAPGTAATIGRPPCTSSSAATTASRSTTRSSIKLWFTVCLDGYPPSVSNRRMSHGHVSSIDLFLHQAVEKAFDSPSWPSVICEYYVVRSDAPLVPVARRPNGSSESRHFPGD